MEITKDNERDMEILKTAYKALDDKFGIDIMVLDIRAISIMADYFVIASGGNPNQIRAMADETAKELARTGLQLRHSEGYQSANWILQDYGNVIVHIFDRESRSFYNLERIWSDAAVVQLR